MLSLRRSELSQLATNPNHTSFGELSYATGAVDAGAVAGVAVGVAMGVAEVGATVAASAGVTGVGVGVGS